MSFWGSSLLHREGLGGLNSVKLPTQPFLWPKRFFFFKFGNYDYVGRLGPYDSL